MNFQFPEFLYALVAIAIPIIIHLFNFRRYKKVYFSNVRFLKNVEETTKAQSKLRQILVLLSRILAIIFLVLAFAQPFVPNETGNGNHEKKAVSIYLDNSFSMESDNADGNRFEIARQYAYEIVKSFDAVTDFQILNNDFSGKQQRFYSKEEALELIDQINISPAVRTTSEVLQRQKSLLEESKQQDRRCYLISDFHQSILDVDAIAPDTFANIFLVPISGENPSNRYIDSVSINSPAKQVNTPIDFTVRITNASAESIKDEKIVLSLNGIQSAIGNYSAKPFETIETILSVQIKEAGLQRGEIELEKDVIDYDNSYSFAFNIKKEIKVVEIKGQSGTDKINLAYSKEPLFNYQTIPFSNVDPTLLNSADVIILNQIENISSGLSSTLNDIVENGKSCVLIPSEKGNLESYNSFLAGFKGDNLEKLDSNRTSSGRLNLNHELFDNVFSSLPKGISLPKINKKFNWKLSSRSNQELIMKADNGQPLIGQYKWEKGKYYVFNFPIDASNSDFTKHALFLPLFYMIGFQAEQAQPIAYTLGEDNFISIGELKLKTDQPVHVVSASLTESTAEFDVIPPIEKTGRDILLNLSNLIEQAGHYDIANQNKIEKALAFNYNRKESKIEIPTPTAIQEKVEKSGWINIQLIEGDYSTISSMIERINQGTQYWKWCLIFALIFIGIEILLLRFLK